MLSVTVNNLMLSDACCAIIVYFEINQLIYCHFGRSLQVTVRPMLRDRCPVCLSVTLVYCGQTVGWIKIRPLGKEAGLVPGNVVLSRGSMLK